ncbi:MAG: hypothetical protein ABI361_03515 [Nitrososphaera sp.]|jgi:predicted unusual protein kinase regulating ubiquinone biosynthesis (AarF/ABC1/UbiB family)
MTFQLPSPEDMRKLEEAERKNVFRRFFAASRYERLLIQQMLVRSAFLPELRPRIQEMEEQQSESFYRTIEEVSRSVFTQEFMAAAREEDAALQKIIEAYDRRMEAAK